MTQLDKFDQSDAWRLAEIAHDLAAVRGYPIVIDIREGEKSLFTVKLPGATDENLNWARRKRNLTLLTKQPSWTY